MIARGVIIIDMQGAVVGQVNGLAVLDFGEFSFGRPSRITARTLPGAARRREHRPRVAAERQDPRQGRAHPERLPGLEVRAGQAALALRHASRSSRAYEPIDGDSASLAELCAILSSLAGAPIRQDLAMTGSVNQKGEVQPIGGVNQKIEGFHDVCKAIGFTRPAGRRSSRRAT